jgi:hypothetical protein
MFYRVLQMVLVLGCAGSVLGAVTRESGMATHVPIAAGAFVQIPVSIPEPTVVLFLILGCIPILALRKRKNG